MQPRATRSRDSAHMTNFTQRLDHLLRIKKFDQNAILNFRDFLREVLATNDDQLNTDEITELLQQTHDYQTLFTSVALLLNQQHCHEIFSLYLQIIFKISQPKISEDLINILALNAPCEKTTRNNTLAVCVGQYSRREQMLDFVLLLKSIVSKLSQSHHFVYNLLIKKGRGNITLFHRIASTPDHDLNLHFLYLISMLKDAGYPADNFDKLMKVEVLDPTKHLGIESYIENIGRFQQTKTLLEIIEDRLLTSTLIDKLACTPDAKEKMFKYITSSQFTEAEQLSFCTKARDPGSALGQFFWVQRGVREPALDRGVLFEISKHIQYLTSKMTLTSTRPESSYIRFNLMSERGSEADTRTDLEKNAEIVCNELQKLRRKQ